MPVCPDPEDSLAAQHEVEFVPVVFRLRVVLAWLELQHAGRPAGPFVEAERVLVGEPSLLEEARQREELGGPISVVTPDACQAWRRSAIRSRGPQRATSSTSASGTAASASPLRPER